MSSITILVVGAGKGGLHLLELLQELPEVEILAVVDKNLKAPGIRFAQEHDIPVARHWAPYCADPRLDIAVNVTGDREVTRQLHRCKSEQCEIIDGKSAHFMWALVEKCKQKEEYRERYLTVQRELEQHLPDARWMVAKSPQMQSVMELVKRVAPTPTTVLLRGETGTGKEMVARAIHQASHLRDKPFISLNCTALTASLMESELFGYKKGAFTGAEQDRKGLLEEAHGGTIFLDEIGDMELSLQAKLLRFLQTGEIRPVGSSEVKYVKVRIIAATNRNLEEAIEQGQFRKDLFYRFNTFTIFLPPLRERKVDIPYLAYHFLTRAEEKLNKRVEKISDQALEILKNYHWPGNVRELENVIERAVILCTGDTILPEHLSITFAPLEPDVRADGDFRRQRSRLMEKYEKQALIEYIHRAGGNISEASRISGIPRRTFYRLMKKYGL